VLFAIAAVFSGTCAMGCWLLLQLSGVSRQDSGGTALVMYCSFFLFLGFNATAAYLREPLSGVRAVIVKTLYLTGVFGLPAIAIFSATSRGAILQMPEVVGLFILFVCFVIVFRPASRWFRRAS